jgi:hypothetical protein
MSLDNIQLPAIVLQDLFTNALVDLNEQKDQPASFAAGTLSFLGENKKKISIIVDHAQVIYLPDDELNFLIGILSACKLGMADVALLNCAKNPSLTYRDIAEQLSVEKILLFGVTPSALALPLQFPHYQIQKYNDQVYLSSPPLKILADNKEEKIKLWGCLKQVFAIG